MRGGYVIITYIVQVQVITNVLTCRSEQIQLKSRQQQETANIMYETKQIGYMFIWVKKCKCSGPRGWDPDVTYQGTEGIAHKCSTSVLFPPRHKTRRAKIRGINNSWERTSTCCIWWWVARTMDYTTTCTAQAENEHTLFKPRPLK